MLSYYWSKFIKKLRLSPIQNSSVHKTSKVESGTRFINSTMDKYFFCDYVNTKIGSYTSIANGAVIRRIMHPMNWVACHLYFIKAETVSEKVF